MPACTGRSSAKSSSGARRRVTIGAAQLRRSSNKTGLFCHRLEIASGDLRDQHVAERSQPIIGRGGGFFPGDYDELIFPAGVKEAAEVGQNGFQVGNRVVGRLQRVGAIGTKDEVGIQFGQLLGAQGFVRALGDCRYPRRELEAGVSKREEMPWIWPCP